jgi:exopolyphosphatase/guanosine-5'-triphosphate,3'-diphosphate pyrophosphatase
MRLNLSPELLASIDIGSHSVLLLVARYQGLGSEQVLVPLIQKAEVCRLLNSEGRATPEQLERLQQILIRFRQTLNNIRANLCGIAMTEAIRKSKDQELYIDLVQKIFLQKPAVLHAQEEAQLAFSAIAKHYHSDDFVSLDVGGGSSELCNGSEYLSMPLGALGLANEFGAVPSLEIKKYLAEFIKNEDLKPFTSKALYLVGGTATALVMYLNQMRDFDMEKIEGQTMDIKGLEHAISRLSDLSKELRAQLPGLHQGRSEIIIPGLMLIHALASALKISEFKISTLGLRFGLIHRSTDAA